MNCYASVILFDGTVANSGTKKTLCSSGLYGGIRWVSSFLKSSIFIYNEKRDFSN